MPQIIVTTGSARDPREGAVMLRERVNAADFESERFAANLIERLGWAVSDANALEERAEAWEPVDSEPEPVVSEPEPVESEPEPEPEFDPEPLGVA